MGGGRSQRPKRAGGYSTGRENPALNHTARPPPPPPCAGRGPATGQPLPGGMLLQQGPPHLSPAPAPSLSCPPCPAAPSPVRSPAPPRCSRGPAGGPAEQACSGATPNPPSHQDMGSFQALRGSGLPGPGAGSQDRMRDPVAVHASGTQAGIADCMCNKVCKAICTTPPANINISVLHGSGACGCMAAHPRLLCRRARCPPPPRHRSP